MAQELPGFANNGYMMFLRNLLFHLSTFLLLVPLQLLADTHRLSDHINLSGFATFGLVQSGDEDLGFVRDLTREGTFDQDISFKQDSLVGLQLDSHFSPDLSATVQLVLRDRADDSLGESIEWAFLRYQLDDEWSFRFGRTVVDLFSLSDYRNVGFAYLWARPPVEFYGPVIFNHIDGIDVTYSKILSESYLTIKFFAGKAENYLANSEEQEEIEINPIYGINASMDYGNWSSRIGLASVSLDSQSDFLNQLIGGLNTVPSFAWPEAGQLAQDLSTLDTDFSYFSIGSTYDSELWIFQTELGYIDSDYEFFPDVVSAYFSLGFRHNNVTYYGVLSAAESTEDAKQVNPPLFPDPSLNSLYLGTQAVSDTSSIEQTTFSLGARWDLYPNMALKVQLDHTEVDAFGSYLWSVSQPLTEDKSINTLSVNVNLVF